MIDEKDRKALIQFRIEQAEETIELVRFLLNNGKYSVAVNRVYYGMFYALSALAIKHGYETSKHRQLLGWFNKEFVAPGMVGVQFGKSLRNAFQSRTRGDYDAFVDFSAEETARMLAEMSDFIIEIKKLVSS